MDDIQKKLKENIEEVPCTERSLVPQENVDTTEFKKVKSTEKSIIQDRVRFGFVDSSSTKLQTKSDVELSETKSNIELGKARDYLEHEKDFEEEDFKIRKPIRKRMVFKLE